MPFKSKQQAKWMYANKPEMAKEWADHTPSVKNLPNKKTTSKAMKKQSKASKMDESLGMRRGKESSKSQSDKSRRDESKGAKKAVKKKRK